MTDGFTVFVVVEMAAQVAAVAELGVVEKAEDSVIGVGVLSGGDDDLHAVAGGKDHAFVEAGRVAKREQRLRQAGRVEGDALANLNRGGAMIEASDVEFHRSLLGQQRT